MEERAQLPQTGTIGCVLSWGCHSWKIGYSFFSMSTPRKDSNEREWCSFPGLAPSGLSRLGRPVVEMRGGQLGRKARHGRGVQSFPAWQNQDLSGSGEASQVCG